MLYQKSLLVTGSGFVVPYFYLQNIIPLYFSRILLLQGITTLLFWYDPIKNKNSIIHKIDSILARINILSYIHYKLFIYKKNAIKFLINTSLMLYFFYLSHKNSRKKWCSIEHLCCHGTAHIISYYSIYLAVI
jgi:hypothetical protein